MATKTTKKTSKAVGADAATDTVESRGGFGNNAADTNGSATTSASGAPNDDGNAMNADVGTQTAVVKRDAKKVGESNGKTSVQSADDQTSDPILAMLADQDKQVEIGLEEDDRAGVVERLNAHLANLHVLYIKTRNYHWNVRGPRFHSLHEFFESQYEQLEESIDDFAERARHLGGDAMGTMNEYMKMATLQEQPGVYPDAQTMIGNLLSDHEAIIRALRDDIELVDDEYEDEGTTDFLTGKLQEHEEMAWMLRAHLTGEN